MCLGVWATKVKLRPSDLRRFPVDFQRFLAATRLMPSSIPAFNDVIFKTLDFRPFTPSEGPRPVFHVIDPLTQRTLKVPNGREGLRSYDALRAAELHGRKPCIFVQETRHNSLVAMDTSYQRRVAAARIKSQRGEILTSAEQVLAQASPLSWRTDQAEPRSPYRNQKDDVVAIRFLGLETDQPMPFETLWSHLELAGFAPFVGAVIESSPHKWHVWIRIERVLLQAYIDQVPTDRDRDLAPRYADLYQRTLAALPFMDHSAQNLLRVFQAPGFLNPAKKDRPAFVTRLQYENPEAPLLTFAQWETLVPEICQDAPSSKKISSSFPSEAEGSGICPHHTTTQPLLRIFNTPTPDDFQRLPTLEHYIQRYPWLKLREVPLNITGLRNQAIKDLCRYSYHYISVETEITSALVEQYCAQVVDPFFSGRTSLDLVSPQARSQIRKEVKACLRHRQRWVLSEKWKPSSSGGLLPSQVETCLAHLFSSSLPGSKTTLAKFRVYLQKFLTTKGQDLTPLDTHQTLEFFLPQNQLRTEVGGRTWAILKAWVDLGFLERISTGSWENRQCQRFRLRVPRLETNPNVELEALCKVEVEERLGLEVEEGNKILFTFQKSNCFFPTTMTMCQTQPYFHPPPPY